MSSIQEDLIPLLVSRQFRGQKATFGKEGLARIVEDEQQQNNDKSDAISDDRSSHSNSTPTHTPDDAPYSVVAVPLPSKTALRVNTISAFLFANKEAIARGCDVLPLPDGSKWNGKFQTLVLANDSDQGGETTSNNTDTADDHDQGQTQAQLAMGKKVQMKSSFVGKNCVVGDKCRLNNVIILDNATIGEQCSLQNVIVGYGATIGPNSSLNDCQVGAGTKVPAQTKEKGEVFTVSDVLDDDGIL
jgi:translation initiation factor eIF-2B subunit gamma